MSPIMHFAGPEDAPISIVLVCGQHGDEYAGQRAGVAIMNYLQLQSMRRGYQINSGGERAKLSFIPGMNQVRMLFAPGLNGPGLQIGSRNYGAPVSHSVGLMMGPESVNLNRCWPDRHSVTEAVWREIQKLPGKVYVIDVHSTWKDHDGDGTPDTHVYGLSGSEDLVRRADPDMLIVPSEVSLADEASSLQGAAIEAGHWSTTLEIGRDESRPDHIGIYFIEKLMREIMKEAA